MHLSSKEKPFAFCLFQNVMICMWLNLCCALQLSPQVVQDGAAQTPEAEEERPGLPGELFNATAQSGLSNSHNVETSID